MSHFIQRDWKIPLTRQQLNEIGFLLQQGYRLVHDYEEIRELLQRD